MHKVAMIGGLVCAALLIVELLAVPRPTPTAPPPQYTVRQVQAFVARQPGRWVGRTVLVQGQLGVYPCVVAQCRGQGVQFFILPPTSAGTLASGPSAIVQRRFFAARPLLLATSSPDPVRSFIQNLPITRRPNSAKWRPPYRVQLLQPCITARCVDGLLLDPPRVGR